MGVFRPLLLFSFAVSQINGLVLPSTRLGVAQHTARAGVAMQFGAKKPKTPTLEERGYWAGEWVCVDCGYIYDPDPEAPFEELKKRWKCPQCAGPRRRFVKKAGSMLGTLDDSSVLYGTIFSFVVIGALVYAGLTI